VLVNRLQASKARKVRDCGCRKPPLLAIPAELYSRLGEERFPREAAQETETFIHEVLGKLAKLSKCVESDWLEE
jgi:hypothetical protein